MQAPFIRLSTTHPARRHEEWHPFKKIGYRVLDADGVTVYHELEAIKMCVLEAFSDVDADIFLFGSRAKGTAHERSDYDIGYYADELKHQKVNALKEKLEEMPIPAKVDLVDFKVLAPEFIRTAIKGGDIWKQKKKNSLFLVNRLLKALSMKAPSVCRRK